VRSGTICPLLLASSPELPPTCINKKFLEVVKEHIDTCTKFRIQLELSKDVWSRVLELFPWSAYKDGADATMRQRAAFWRQAVLAPLQRNCDMVECTRPTASRSSRSFACLVSGDTSLVAAWDTWLRAWSAGTNKVRSRFEKGIATPQQESCPTGGAHICGDFILVNDAKGWRRVLFPWYLIYPEDLPCEGDLPFAPPPNWRTGRIKRGPGNGYLDASGNEWVPDKLHRDHWDVQLRHKRGYIRVSADGRTLP
jgi:hypothetical protein